MNKTGKLLPHKVLEQPDRFPSIDTILIPVTMNADKNLSIKTGSNVLYLTSSRRCLENLSIYFVQSLSNRHTWICNQQGDRCNSLTACDNDCQLEKGFSASFPSVLRCYRDAIVIYVEQRPSGSVSCSDLIEFSVWTNFKNHLMVISWLRWSWWYFFSLVSE